jgi:hypothetical protein
MKEVNFYLIGKSENEILCYDEQKHWQKAGCYYFSGNAMFFIRYDLPDARNLMADDSKFWNMFPDLKGKLHIYFYELTEKISLMDEP